MGFGFMNIATTINMVLTNVQFIALLNNLDVEWPEEWSNFLDVFAIFNLDPRDLLGESEVPLIDFRMLFIIISIILPLFINIMILLLYRPIGQIAWYTTFVFGLVVFIAGALGRLLPSAGFDGAAETSNLYMIIGGACFGGMLLLLLCYRLWRKYHPQEDTEEAIAAQHMYLMKFHRRRAFVHFGLSMFFGFIGVIFTGIVDLHIQALDDALDNVGGFLLAIGWTCLVFGAWMFLYFFINLFKCGRKAVDKVQTFLKANLLLVLLLLISASYIPTISYCLNIFMCTRYTCPAGTVFNPYASRAVSSYDTSESRYCDKCDFLNTGCGAVNVTALCPGYSGYRNWKQPDTPCDDEAAVYFYFAAAIVLVCYLISIPLLYKKVIDYIIPEINEGITVSEGLSDDEVWERQVLMCRPAAASLYEPFYISRRYYTIIMLAHRLLVITILVVVAPFSNAAAALVLVIHGAAATLMMIFKPYMNHYEQGLAIGLNICNVLNGIYAVVVWQRGTQVPAWTTGLFIFLNVIVPICITVVMKVIQLTRASKEEEERKQKKKEAREAFLEEQKRLREEAQASNSYFEEKEWDSEEWDSEGSDWEPDADFDATVSGQPSGQATPQPAQSPVTQNPGNQPYGSNPYIVTSAPPPERSKTPPPPATAVEMVPDSDEDDDRPAADLSKSEAEAKAERKALRKKQRKWLKRQSAKLREKLNADTGSLLSKFFMIMGVFLFIALGAAVLGTVRQKDPEFRIATSSLRRATKWTLAEYKTWDEMTSSCCCTNSSNPSIRFNATERWVCKNGLIMDRGRVSRDLADNSLPFRSMCSASFNSSLPSCNVIVDTTIDTPSLKCSELDRAEYPGVTDQAYKYYW